MMVAEPHARTPIDAREFLSLQRKLLSRQSRYQRLPPSRYRYRNLWRVCALMFVLTCTCLACQPQSETIPPKPSQLAATSNRRDARQIEADVDNFCGACHPTPRPEEFPRDEWRAEVQQGFDFYLESSLFNVRVPAMTDVVAYYEARAAEKLPTPEASPDLEMGSLSFDQMHSPNDGGSPAIAHLRWPAAPRAGRQALIACDMRSGVINAWNLDRSGLVSEPLAKLRNPSHAEAIDLGDQDRRGWIVADLGSFPPADHDRGMVVMLVESDDGTGVSSRIVHEGMGRASDVQAGDLDGDLDLDLVVAEFGWRRSGRLFWLENKGSLPSETSYEPHLIDERHGALFAPIVDLNGDGLLDVVAAFGQEHESVDVFYNLGSGKFRQEQLFRADRATFGMSGIEIVDLDADQDNDIVFINGDMFDDYHLRPYHGIHWLENRGQQWEHHDLYRLPGVTRTKSVDIDADGDLDIVACALIPRQVMEQHAGLRLASLVCLEQTSTGEFTPRILEVGKCDHAALEAGDFDEDGDIDLAVGNYSADPEITLPDLSIWWNLRQDAVVRRP